MRTRLRLIVAMVVLAPIVAVTLAPARAQDAPDQPSGMPYLTAQVRDVDPVVLTGADLPMWAAPADITVATPSLEAIQCAGEEEIGLPNSQTPDTPLTSSDPCSHNSYDDPLVSTQQVVGVEGPAIDRLHGYRWTGSAFEQIPFQVDEMFERYLSNDVSGFAFYSGRDKHTTYAFDREGFRWTASDPNDPCLAAPASDVAGDPVPGLDTDDELVFMARDTGRRAPSTATLPAGINDMVEVTVTDPVSAITTYAYIARAAHDGPRPAFTADTGYVRYQRDPDADVFLFSESSYEDYGAAPAGPWFDPATGVCHSDPDEWFQHRPGDQATITTPRYRFRYEGRWLMTELQVSANQDWEYGADLIDQWKARAFQQRPGGETPCCGFEEEVNNWGGSSILMGERSGPVRTIRETWGADSGTNVVRRETFYRDEVHFGTYLRVHPIPPLDGIYMQMDHNVGAIDTYYNPHNPDGVPVDGVNDEVFGNSYVSVSSAGIGYDGNDGFTDLLDELVGTPIVVGEIDGQPCDGDVCVHNDIDSPDPAFSGVNALLNWEQVDGPAGSLVFRLEPLTATPGNVAHTPLAVPYYRDDSCFDDGTGSDPGPHLHSRGVDDGEYATWTDERGVKQDRECWDADRHAADGEYAADVGSERFFQGSIGTHGMHLLAVVESDNASTTVPATEITSTWRVTALPPQDGNVGEAYGRRLEQPLVTTVGPTDFTDDGGATSDGGEWIAGDLHVHTTYSHDSLGVQFDEDGNPQLDDEIDPAEAYTIGNTVVEQFAVAAARGLDFLAITDHNRVDAQSDPGWEASGVVGIPAYEKSLNGHAQMVGATKVYPSGDLDQDGESNDADDVQMIADALRADGGVFQQNHPTSDYAERGEIDLDHLDWGYGYGVVPDTLEVWNIGPLWQPPMPSASSLDDALRYWNGYLDRGHRVGATGGSDNHYKATLPVQGPGQPTTWVFATDRTVAGVLDGLRNGRTFVSWQPPAHGGPQLLLEADGNDDGTFEAIAGDAVDPAASWQARVVNAPPGASVRIVVDRGEMAAELDVPPGEAAVQFTVPGDTTWVRAELVVPDGQDVRVSVCDEALGDQTTYCRNRLGLLAISSPIYVERSPGRSGDHRPGDVPRRRS